MYMTIQLQIGVHISRNYFMMVRSFRRLIVLSLVHCLLVSVSQHLHQVSIAFCS